MIESRLKRNLKNKAMRNLVLVAVGFVIILAFLIIIGGKLLVAFSLFIEKGNDTSNTNSQQSDSSFISPPTLNSIVDATNSADLTVSGSAIKDQAISLYVNDELVDKTSVDDKNNFKFSSVTLKQGQNTIKAKAENDNNKQSDYSNMLTITYQKGAPKLSIDQPSDGQGFSKSSSPSVNIQGQTDPGDNITVNGSWAILDDQGKYSYLYTLKDGDNDIKVVATDNAGNQTTKEIHIHTQ